MGDSRAGAIGSLGLRAGVLRHVMAKRRVRLDRLPLPRELRLSFHLFKYVNLHAISCAILQIYTT